MNQIFDPFNIILLVIAVVVLLRLGSVLGTRTGHEKPMDLSLPGSKEGEGSETARAEEEEKPVRIGPPPEEPAPVWEGVAEPDSELARTLERMREIDAAFDPRHFLDGAGVAYEMIITAFAQGDKRALKPLLSREVLRQFSEVIEERRKAGQRHELQFVGLDEARLVDAELQGSVARLTVRFTSKVISALRDAQGKVVQGDPEKLKTVRDVWTFERDLSSSDPNWRLIATGAAD